VPAPRNSAQHDAATRCYQKMNEKRTNEQQLDASGAVTAPPPHHPTRQLALRPDTSELPDHSTETIQQTSAPTQFAGIAIHEFIAARQRARRVLTTWVLVILIFTGLIAAGAWTLGSHLAAFAG